MTRRLSFSALMLSLALVSCSGNSKSAAERALEAAAPGEYAALEAAQTLVGELEETAWRAASREWRLVKALEALYRAAPQEIRGAILVANPNSGLEDIAQAAPEQWSDFVTAFGGVFEGRAPTAWRDIEVEPVIQTLKEAAPEEWDAYAAAVTARKAARDHLKAAAPEAWAAYEATKSPAEGEADDTLWIEWWVEIF